jgi:hypothetical protein
VAARCCLFDTLLSSNLSSSLVTLSTRLRSACFYNQETQNRCTLCGTVQLYPSCGSYQYMQVNTTQY